MVKRAECASDDHGCPSCGANEVTKRCQCHDDFDVIACPHCWSSDRFYEKDGVRTCGRCGEAVEEET